SNKTAKDLWDALARHMLGSEYGEQDRKAIVLYCSILDIITQSRDDGLADFCRAKSSNDDSNIVNAPQEPIVFNQDPGENSSQSPPQIDHQCCYGCDDSLDGIFCQQCTCKSCGKGAHYGYNCPLKVSIISNLEPCHDQNVEEFP
nr:hypothetical protein [Tanacetum cinerariifolium]